MENRSFPAVTDNQLETYKYSHSNIKKEYFKVFKLTHNLKEIGPIDVKKFSMLI